MGGEKTHLGTRVYLVLILASAVRLMQLWYAGLKGGWMDGWPDVAISKEGTRQLWH